MKSLSAAIESAIKTATIFTYLNNQVTCAVGGYMPVGWTNNGIVIAPGGHTPQNYPASISNHTELIVVVHCYAEFFGERIGLMGDDHFKGILDMEQDIRDFLTPDGNESFLGFDGLVSACFWTGTVYPDVRRTHEAWNEARVTFAYRN